MLKTMRHSFRRGGDNLANEPHKTNAVGWILGSKIMIEKILYAAVRAALVAILMLLPTAILPEVGPTSMPIVGMLALIAAIFTFTEYSAVSPNLIEFRDAPPFNRTRFVSLASTLFILSIIASAAHAQNTFSKLMAVIGFRLSELLDFPFSPVRLMVLMLPQDASNQLMVDVRVAAGNAYLISLVTLAFFVVYLRRSDWPNAGSHFNFYVNLPNFDPTSGSDVVERLQRSAQINMILGFLLPFLIPAVVKWMTSAFDVASLADPQVRIWTITAWAFLPMNLFMRGFAFMRVSDMIGEQRRRTYAEAVAEGTLPAA